MEKVVLLTGGNIGNIEVNMALARQMIAEKVGHETAASTIYQSKAWGFDSDDVFMNQVLVVETKMEPMEVLEAIHEIENKLGRVRDESKTGYQSRTMDIDILYFGERVIDNSRLKVPHPLIDQREFVLIPLRELGIK